MMAIIEDLSDLALDNDNFRKVICTTEHSQVVAMSIPAGGEIGMEIHPDNEQYLAIARGSAKVTLDGDETEVEAGALVIVEPGVEHNVENTGTDDLKIITTYIPPHHPDGTVHATKAEADEAEEAEGH